MAMIPDEDKSEEAGVLRTRLKTLLDVFALIDLIFDQVFSSDEAFRQAVETYKNPGDRPVKT
jgi:hypothetical protein